MSTQTANGGPAKERAGLGTFAGVFTPSVLTILGIILFLRLGFVVGNAGLGRALIVIAIANSISVLTSFSLAAIATNFEVRAGGDYYLISRTLGPEFGGAIGIVLFLAQSISVAFYAIGFAEGVTALVQVDWLSPRLVAGAALLPLLFLAWLGSDWATKFQYVIMAFLALALVSFTLGAFGSFDVQVLESNWSAGGDMTFWAIFALFFPAVTGFTQGVSMSGDLEEPARSLPLGTFLAVAISLLVYVGLAVLFAGALPAAELVVDYGAMGRIALFPALITAGIFAATLSSALASFMGSPRILQALAKDRLFRFLDPFALGVGESANPRRAVLLCFVIAAATVALGNLNVVAPIVSMFFLISYGLLNYATYFEASAKSPSFRPRFRWYRPWVSLLGCLVCAGTILAIDPVAGAIAIAVLFGIHQYLARSGAIDRWADSSRSAQFQRIRRSLLEMGETVEHDRDWRPVTLAFSDDPARRERILRLASWIEGGAGLTTAVRLVEGEGPRVRAECARLETELAADVRERGLRTFARVFATPDLDVGFRVLLQTAGLGPIRPNIALFNWFDNPETAEDAPAMQAYGQHLRVALQHGCSVVVLAAWSRDLERLAEESDAPRRIDVWWYADASSRLALLLAYLMTRGAPWTRASLRVLTPRRPDTPDEEVVEELRARLDEVRIPGEPAIAPDPGWSAMAAATRGADLVLVPFRLRATGLFDLRGEPLPESLEGLPPLVLVHASGDIALDAQPDEGAQADQARAQDTEEEARARAEAARAKAEEARAAADAAQRFLAEADPAETSAEDLAGLTKGAERAEAEAVDAERRAIKAEVKAQHAAEAAAAPEGEPPSDPAGSEG